MTPHEIEQAANAICSARREGRLMAGLDEVTPRTMADGYAVQDAFMRVWDDAIAGWKVGATAAGVQDLYGVEEPFCGPFYAATTYTSPARLAADDFGHLCIESEFAFRFARDVPARDEGYPRGEILDAIDVVIPAFELIAPRFDTFLRDRVALATADCGLNGGVVLGEPYAAWRGLDLGAHPVCLTVDGNVKGEGTGGNVLGHPFNVLDWLVNALSARGLGLKAGEIVSTGTCTGIVTIKRGQKAVADYGRLGQVEATFI